MDRSRAGQSPSLSASAEEGNGSVTVPDPKGSITNERFLRLAARVFGIRRACRAISVRAALIASDATGSYSTEQLWEPVVRGIHRGFVGVRELQTVQLAARGPDDLNADR